MQKPKRLFDSLRKIPAVFLTLAVIMAGMALAATEASAAEVSATDEYEAITDRTAFDQRIADALANGQTFVKIDYSGEGWNDVKSWLKKTFDYPVLSRYCDELAIYNYDRYSCDYWTHEDEKRVEMEITLQYKLDAEQLAAVDAYAENFIDSNGLRDMSPYDQLLTVHNWLIDNFTYSLGADSLYQMTQDGLANCYGYTMMNYLIMNKLGVDIRTTHGRVNRLHIWNVVNLDGSWYYEDVTWDTAEKNTDYFLISASKLLKTHKIEGGFLVDCLADYQKPPVATEEPAAAEEPIATEEPTATGEPIATEEPVAEEPAAAEGTSGNLQPAEPEPAAVPVAVAATAAPEPAAAVPVAVAATAAPEPAAAAPEAAAAPAETVAAPAAILYILLAAGIILGIRIFRKSAKRPGP